MSTITTHVLDTSRGRPAAELQVKLEVQSDQGWTVLGSGVTDGDGRAGGLLPPETALRSGVYRLVFNTGDYFSARRVVGFYPRVEIVFQVDQPDEHYHVPLLLNPFGYCTYRGS